MFERIEQSESRLHRQDNNNHNHEGSRDQCAAVATIIAIVVAAITTGVVASRPIEVLMLAQATTTAI